MVILKKFLEKIDLSLFYSKRKPKKKKEGRECKSERKNKGMRELKNLKCEVNYDGVMSRRNSVTEEGLL